MAMDLDDALNAMHRRLDRIDVARAAIVKACGEWKKGYSRTVRREIDCPVCGVARALQFVRSGVNGGIKAKCQTEGCITWQEYHR